MKTIVLRKTKIIENFEKEVETETQRKQNSRKTVSVVGMVRLAHPPGSFSSKTFYPKISYTFPYRINCKNEKKFCASLKEAITCPTQTFLILTTPPPTNKKKKKEKKNRAKKQFST